MGFTEASCPDVSDEDRFLATTGHCSGLSSVVLIETQPLLQLWDEDRNVNHLQLGDCDLNIFLLRKTGKFLAGLVLSVNLQDFSGALN